MQCQDSEGGGGQQSPKRLTRLQQPPPPAVQLPTDNHRPVSPFSYHGSNDARRERRKTTQQISRYLQKASCKEQTFEAGRWPISLWSLRRRRWQLDETVKEEEQKIAERLEREKMLQRASFTYIFPGVGVYLVVCLSILTHLPFASGYKAIAFKYCIDTPVHMRGEKTDRAEVGWTLAGILTSE